MWLLIRRGRSGNHCQGLNPAAKVFMAAGLRLLFCLLQLTA